MTEGKHYTIGHFARRFYKNYFKACISHQLRKIFKFSNLDSFNHASQAKISPRFSSSPQKQSQITHSPSQYFLENLFFLSRKKGGKLRMSKLRMSHLRCLTGFWIRLCIRTKTLINYF